MKDGIPLELIKSKLNQQHIDILNFLSDFENVNFQDLIKKFGMSRSVNSSLDNLVGAILIEKKINPSDARRYKFSITSYGLKILKDE